MTSKDIPPLRVLVVEDDPDSRDVMHRLVEGAGYDARSAASVGEAVGVLHEWLPTHVLLDLMLPDYEGVVLLRMIRQNKFAVRVAAVTAAGRGSDAIAEVERERVDAVFHKPVQFQAIEKWLAQQRP